MSGGWEQTTILTWWTHLHQRKQEIWKTKAKREVPGPWIAQTRVGHFNLSKPSRTTPNKKQSWSEFAGEISTWVAHAARPAKIYRLSSPKGKNYKAGWKSKTLQILVHLSCEVCALSWNLRFRCAKVAASQSYMDFSVIFPLLPRSLVSRRSFHKRVMTSFLRRCYVWLFKKEIENKSIISWLN